jgi:hypothetical protein
MERHVVLFVVLAVLAGIPSAAAQRVDPAEFQRFLKSEVYQTLITQALHRAPPAMARHCSEIRHTQGAVSVVRPMTFGPDGIMNGGAWEQTLAVSACGGKTIVKLYLEVTGRGKIRTAVGAPATGQPV